ncbi:MAG: hypothetical protein IKG98_05650 [Ruminococcus sp.]|nr:hypothetical protein [Ruminococcus sp.]
MKLSAIWALLKKRKTAVIQKSADTQWVGDGYAAYPIYVLPDLDNKTMQILLDVKDEAWESFNVRLSYAPPFCEEDFEIGEKEMRELDVTINYHGSELIPLTVGDEIYFIQAQYLKPFNDFEPLFFLRRNRASQLIAVKEGMLLRGVLAPYHFDGVGEELFVNALRDISVRAEHMYDEHNKVAEVADELRNLSFEDDEEDTDDES